jgi:hypothetical protein
MPEDKWDKKKKHDTLQYLSIDEIIVLFLGFLIFQCFQPYEVLFIIVVILWYWFKIRYYERKIIEKERDIYNVYYENCAPVSQSVIDGRTAVARKPLEYDLEQLENKRKFLTDKFIVVNLILVVLIELFIKK